jgi:hypothetical protein
MHHCGVAVSASFDHHKQHYCAPVIPVLKMHAVEQDTIHSSPYSYHWYSFLINYNIFICFTASILHIDAGSVTFVHAVDKFSPTATFTHSTFILSFLLRMRIFWPAIVPHILFALLRQHPSKSKYLSSFGLYPHRHLPSIPTSQYRP